MASAERSVTGLTNYDEWIEEHNWAVFRSSKLGLGPDIHDQRRQLAAERRLEVVRGDLGHRRYPPRERRPDHGSRAPDAPAPARCSLATSPRIIRDPFYIGRLAPRTCGATAYPGPCRRPCSPAHRPLDRRTAHAPRVTRFRLLGRVSAQGPSFGIAAVASLRVLRFRAK